VEEVEMTRTLIVMLCGAALVAGCGGAQPEADTSNAEAANAAAVLTNFQEEVVALPTRAQEGVMLRAIRDARLDCQQVTELTRVEDRAGNLRWRVVCDGRNPYVVELSADGTARIRSRR
jgi:hypothetical protein